MNSSNDSRHRAARVVIIGGVSGCGKSTVGRALAEYLGWSFIEGDAFHSEANIEKMRRGEALDDNDRRPWLESLHNEIIYHLDRGISAVMACSALKASYREILCGDEVNVSFVFLSCSRESLHRRLTTRQGHFLGAELLDSQLAAFESSHDILLIDSEQAVETLVESIADWLAYSGSECDET
ncbi:gluconokinase [Methylotuvimicrobium alcaliphilum]|jgi:gluconokinase|uniref:Gluconokinase n=1 Tax=Methylotuvimicrobium alcaliphilum (strain DSM 19304 / NCIMB 14124 / VKM B-2133 / 20Z) TaxID=1091494 RepID=G4T089_META2|nr:gluconokinase [Methylotuvimicrobium alcaliphilum]CCE23379.1 gluconokinase [Methylotuvimicrobium alcaliphilum 20Z]